NPNSICQATGAIGLEGTFGACIPSSTFGVAADCPSGTHALDDGDGVFHCVPPSGIECNFADLLDNGTSDMSAIGSACTFEHSGDTVSGRCFGSEAGALACLATCVTETVNADGTVNEDSGCYNPNSVCQATGAIGVDATFGACIPASSFAAAGDCPSGTHAVDGGAGTFRCLPPSGIECNGGDLADDSVANLSNLGDACTFEHNGDSVSGKCFGAEAGALACVALCGTETESVTGAVTDDYACGNPNSLCQATGLIGADGTFGACIPADTFGTAADCPSGTHPVDGGDGTFRCVPPSGIECNAADFWDDAVRNMSNLGTACQFEHGGDTVTGKCFGAAVGALAC
ncbi:uncharacterized protein METZ01_LOCUS325133, partial [marine metagenome]